MLKRLIFLFLALILILAIFLSLKEFKLPQNPITSNPSPSVHFLEPSPTLTPEPLPNASKKACQENSDCSVDEVCTQAGPIAIDPITKKTITKKTCWPKGAAIPL